MMFTNALHMWFHMVFHDQLTDYAKEFFEADGNKRLAWCNLDQEEQQFEVECAIMDPRMIDECRRAQIELPTGGYGTDDGFGCVHSYLYIVNRFIDRIVLRGIRLQLYGI